MPKDKSGDGYHCINECGALKEVHADNPIVVGNALVQVEKPEGGLTSLNLNSGFVVKLFLCESCGYIEMYDVPKTDLE